jgi:hypothetical protein
MDRGSSELVQIELWVEVLEYLGDHKHDIRSHAIGFLAVERFNISARTIAATLMPRAVHPPWGIRPVMRGNFGGYFTLKTRQHKKIPFIGRHCQLPMRRHTVTDTLVSLLSLPERGARVKLLAEEGTFMLKVPSN